MCCTIFLSYHGRASVPKKAENTGKSINAERRGLKVPGEKKSSAEVGIFLAEKETLGFWGLLSTKMRREQFSYTNPLIAC